MKKLLRIFAQSILVALSLIVLLSSGCSEIQHRKQKPECKAVYSLIKTDWSLDTLPGLHKIRRDPNSQFTRDILTCQDCFIGLALDDIEKLFGTPDTIFRGQMAYFLGSPCLQKDGIEANGCQYMLCSFGKEKTVTALDFVSNGYKH